MSTSASSSLSIPVAASQQPQQRIFTISCTACRQRKIKCTRIKPCLPCQQAGYDCEFPQRQRALRQKRGKTIPPAKVADLADRLAGVEALLSQMIAKEEDNESTDPPEDGDMVTPEPDSMSNGEEHYAGCSFWKALCLQIGGLHELISEPLDYPYTESNTSSSQTPDQTREGFSNLIVGQKPSTASLICPSPAQALALLDIFISNIDPVIKFLHIPTLRTRINSQFSLQKKPPKLRHMDALIAAVFFASVTSMTEEECQTCLQMSKESAVTGLKSAVENSLARSNFMGRADMTNLQALILFIGCLRSTDTSKAPWTMVAVVVRLAHMLSLHRDGQGLQFTPFEAEMRRRLWWQVVLLDMRASEDWGSDFIITEDSFNTCAPTNINDCDMAINATSTYVNCEGVTEMTFGLMFCEASKMVKLFHIPLDERQPRSLQERLRIVLACQKELNENFFPNHKSDAPISWATHTIGRLIIYKAWLLVHYPMKPQDWTAMETSVKREDLLMTSTMILELSHKLESNEDMKQWRWLFETYIPWHALAVTLVELCVQSPSPLKNKAWAIADILFDAWSQRVVGTSAGFVWLPIKKLHAKAHEIRLTSASSPSLESEYRDKNSLTLALTPQEYDGQTFMEYAHPRHDISQDTTNQHDFWAANPDMALDLVQTDLRISTFNVDGWDYAPTYHHDDPSMHANWADWDDFMQDTSGLMDPGLIP